MHPMLQLALFLVGMSAVLAILPNLCLIGLFQGCKACHSIMSRGATVCPSCRTPVERTQR